MESLVVVLNFVLAVALGVGLIWLGHAWLDSWWTLILTIPIALSILGSWARWTQTR